MHLRTARRTSALYRAPAAGSFLWRPLGLVVVVLLVGTLGYMHIEEWPVLDALYMTVITMTTVGFGEVQDLSAPGREFTIVLVIISVAAGALAVASVTSFLIEGHLRGAIRDRRREHVLSKLEGHIVVCGFGRVGTSAARALAAAGSQCVIISQDAPESVPSELESAVVLRGDATAKEVLTQARVTNASGVICALDSDAKNIMLILTLQELAPSATVVARATSDQAEHLMHRAGADVVICPYRTAGERLAGALLRPGVHSFLDVVTAGGSGPFKLNEVHVDARSPHIGRTLAELQAVRKTDARVIGIAKPWGQPILNPTGATMLAEGDHVIVAGTEEQIAEFIGVLHEGNGG